MRIPFTRLLLLAASLGSGISAARAQTTPGLHIERGSLVATLEDGTSTTIDLGCTPRFAAVERGRGYVACTAEVFVIALSQTGASIERRLSASGTITGLFEANGSVWVQTSRTAAEPVDELAGARIGTTPPVDESVTPVQQREAAASPGREGDVAATHGEGVVVTLGSRDGLGIGAHVELFTVRDEDLGDGHPTTQERRVAVGEVVSVGHDRATVRLGLGERVPDDARARATRVELSRSLVAPPRIGSVLSIAAMARPLLPVDDLGFVLFSDLRATYRGERHWFVRGEVDPLGFGVTQGRDQSLFGARVLAGYDHPLFGVGLGVGAVRIDDRFSDPENGALHVVRGVAFSMDQYVRIGAVDGLHLEVTNGFALEQGIVRWVRTRGAIQIPVAHRVWLRLEAGDGKTGIGWGEIGVRYLARGNGGAGSLFLLGSAGGGSFFFGPGQTAGAHVGAGLELRL